MAPTLELEECVRTLKLRGNAAGISLHVTKHELRNMLMLPQPSRQSAPSCAASEASKLAIEDGAADSQSSSASVAESAGEKPSMAIAVKLAASMKQPPIRKKSVAETLAELKRQPSMPKRNQQHLRPIERDSLRMVKVLRLKSWR